MPRYGRNLRIPYDGHAGFRSRRIARLGRWPPGPPSPTASTSAGAARSTSRSSSIEGDDGLLVVDTGAEPAEAEEILADLASRFDRPVRWVVNTHAHFDHTFGNQVFGPGSTTDAAIHGHAGIARHFERYEGPRLAAWRADPHPRARTALGRRATRRRRRIRSSG